MWKFIKTKIFCPSKDNVICVYLNKAIIKKDVRKILKGHRLGKLLANSVSDKEPVSRKLIKNFYGSIRIILKKSNLKMVEIFKQTLSPKNICSFEFREM